MSTAPPKHSTRPMADKRSSLSLGPYLVHDLIGRGKTGNVFRAHHSELQHPVALKVLPPLRGTDKKKQRWSNERIKTFSRELETATQVVHDNIARPTCLGQHNDVQYVAMEYVDGVSLQTIVDRDGKLSTEIACEVVLQAAVGLRHIHENRLIHRDLRPANILLTKTGIIKITDLGIGSLKVTKDCEQLGDASYLAPEQLATGEADIRSDIYGLGCTLYRLLAGKAPNVGTDRQHEPQPLAELVQDVSPDLVEVVNRMMARNPADRMQTPNEVVLAMCQWATGQKTLNLVDWHLNTKNAGLAPAATFEQLERWAKKREQAQQVKKDPRKNVLNFPGTNSKTTERASSVNGNTSAKRRYRAIPPASTPKQSLAQLAVLTAVVFFGPVLGALALLFLQSNRESPQSTSPAASTVTSARHRESLANESYHRMLLLDFESTHGLPAAEWILPPHESAATNNAIHYGATITQSEVNGYDFTQATQLSMSQAGSAVWDAGYFVPDVTGLQAADRVLLVIWLRTAEVRGETGSSGKLAVFVEDASTDEKDVYMPIRPTSEWQQYLIPFESRTDAVRRLGFHLAYDEQVIEFGGLAVLNYGDSIPFSRLPFQLNSVPNTQ